MKVIESARWMSKPQRIAAVLWITFLTASAATGVFFSIVDPMALGDCIDLPKLSRTGAYTVGFFLFWLLTGGSALLAVMFVYPPKND